jgi:hypothetical protein
MPFALSIAQERSEPWLEPANPATLVTAAMHVALG